MRKLKVGIIGVGMVGEPIMRWFMEVHQYTRGKNLFCYDTDPKKGYTDDVNRADIIFIAVPTPANPDGTCNTSIVESAIASVKDRKTVVIKSTVVPGFVERMQKYYPKKKLILNPEFLTESQAWADFIRPDRQLAATTSKSRTGVQELLALLPMAPFVRPWSSDYTKKDISPAEASMTKSASNVFGFMKVAYGNILADVCYALDHVLKEENVPASVDYENVREALSADPRIGPAWMNVSHGNYCGAGGYCFPKDMDAFIGFMHDVIQKLRKSRRSPDVELVKTLKKGVAVFEALRDYNKALLQWQGLSVEDVSRHDKEMGIKKKKEIRKK